MVGMKLKNLRKSYEDACNMWLRELCISWELRMSDGFWIGDEVGGIWDSGDGDVIVDMQDIIYIVEHDVTYDTYCDWRSYNSDAAEFGYAYMRLKSYCEGERRIPQYAFDRLHQMKKDFEDAIDEYGKGN